MRVLVTGASGYLGSQVVSALSQHTGCGVLALDVRAPAHVLAGVQYETADIRSPEVDAILGRFRPRVVVHLASIVTPGKDSTRDFEYSVDVDGTRNLLAACVRHDVRQLVVSSSGAAYGYHADNAAWLDEQDPLRGNEAFAYSWHKRLVEEMLARSRVEHPALGQLVFRIGTILGERVNNQITALFEKPFLIAIAGAESPFVFVHDSDVVGAILHGVVHGTTGVYNVAGDGCLGLREIAARLGCPRLVLPAGLLALALRVLKAVGLTRYGPEQVDFLRYRPVLSNRRLKHEFGYVPRLDSSAVFDAWLAARRRSS